MTIAEQDDSRQAKWRTEWLDGLHKAYEFFAEHPDLIPTSNAVTIRDYTSTDEKARAIRWAKALGNADKRYSDVGALFYVEAKPGRFGPHTVGYTANRASVCTKNVTVVKREETVPDPEVVRERLADIPTITRTVKDEVVTWDCDPLLAES